MLVMSNTIEEMSPMLKATGYVRPVDNLGRIVIPVEVRRDLSIANSDEVEIYVDGGSIVLEKYVPGCLFCDAHEDLFKFRGKLMCRSCLKAMTGTLGSTV